MQAASEFHQDLVLVGGGHSHALALRMLAMKSMTGVRITLISSSSHTPYSGMLPGLIAGHYRFEETHIDLVRLCQWAGVRFIAAQVTAIDPEQRLLTLAGRPPLSYDLVSIDIGSQPELDSVPGARAHAIPVKPVAGLWQRWQELHARRQQQDTREDCRISVVGGGAGSVELALAMSQRLAQDAVGLDLWCGAAEILQNYNKRARQSVMAALEDSGIVLHLNARVVQVDGDCLVLEDGTRAVYDDLFWCTGAAAEPWVAASGLPVDEQGFLAVTDTLQSTADERVFGAGDIATQVRHPRPKAGVFAVRQAPVLAHNLRAMLLQKPLREHRPQRRFLSLVSLGGTTATADKGPFSVTGDWVWRWKDYIDRGFMKKFVDLPRAMPSSGRLRESQDAAAQPVCGGCGAKVGSDALSGALVQLHKEFPDHCVGTGDDAATVPAPDGMQLLQSLDVLRELVSDPWQMGRIAANHALSDLYACAARPISALAAVTLPYAGDRLLQRELRQILSGALHEFAAVDCQLNGGHSMQGPELSVGFLVNGVPMSAEGRLLAKTGVTAGDELVLSKPLGTGMVFAAHMQLAADGRDVGAAVDAMLQGNAAAAELAVSAGATACTDITGFGLLGHLLEMLAGAMGARLIVEHLPLLPGALQLSRQGVLSTMHPDNVNSFGRYLDRSGQVDAARLRMLFDPQTSGGLLIAVPAGGGQPLVDELHRAGYSQACRIGEVIARPSVGSALVHIS